MVNNLNKSTAQLLGYIEGKLEELHVDVKDLRTEVTELKTDLIRRRSVHSAMMIFFGVITSGAASVLAIFK